MGLEVGRKARAVRSFLGLGGRIGAAARLQSSMTNVMISVRLISAVYSFLPLNFFIFFPFVLLFHTVTFYICYFVFLCYLTYQTS